MRLSLLLLGVALLSVAAWAQDDVEPEADQQGLVPHFQLIGGLSFGSLLAGHQYDNLHDGLTPTPEHYDRTALFVAARYYPWDNFGFEATADVLGVVQVWSKNTKVLNAYQVNVYSAGVIARTVTFLVPNQWASWFAAVGANINTFSYHADFTSLFSGSKFYAVTSGLGFFAKVGGELDFSDPFFGGFELGYVHLDDTVGATGYQMNGDYFKGGLYVGLAF